MPVSHQLASKLLAVASQSLAILPDWLRRTQPTRLSVPTSIYHLVVCLVGTGSAILVDQTTDGSIRFVTTPATCPWRYGDQPFSMTMAQEWRNGPHRLREHDDDDDDDIYVCGTVALYQGCSPVRTRLVQRNFSAAWHCSLRLLGGRGFCNCKYCIWCIAFIAERSIHNYSVQCWSVFGLVMYSLAKFSWVESASLTMAWSVHS